MDSQQIITELARKYNNTYIMSKDSRGNPFTCYVSSVTSDGSGNNATGRMELDSLEFGKLQYKIPSNEAIIFKQPRSRAFQFNDRSMFLFREPRRQWSRGMCPSNTRIIDVAMTVATMTDARGYLAKMDLPLISELFKEKQHTFQEGFKNIKTGKFISCACGGPWSLVLPGTLAGDTFILVCRTSAVATITADGEIVELVNKCLEPQIRELISNANH